MNKKDNNVWELLRKDKKLTLKQVSEKTGISIDTLVRIEKGKLKNINANHIYELSVVYNEDYTYLMNCAGYKTPKKERSDRDELLGGYKRESKTLIKTFLDFLDNQETYLKVYRHSKKGAS